MFMMRIVSIMFYANAPSFMTYKVHLASSKFIFYDSVVNHNLKRYLHKNTNIIKRIALIVDIVSFG
jgi:hypothetical protein